MYKIGSARDLDRRLAQLRTAAPYLERVQTITCYAYREIEKELHRIFANKRETGEWFSLNDGDLDIIAATEWKAFPAEVAREAELSRIHEVTVRVFQEIPGSLEALRRYYQRREVIRN